jgi:hypothetical protein
MDRDQPGRNKRAAGTKNTALFDIVNAATANGSCEPRIRTFVSRASERQRAKTRDPGVPRQIDKH